MKLGRTHVATSKVVIEIGLAALMLHGCIVGQEPEDDFVVEEEPAAETEAAIYPVTDYVPSTVANLKTRLVSNAETTTASSAVPKTNPCVGKACIAGDSHRRLVVTRVRAVAAA